MKELLLALAGFATPFAMVLFIVWFARTLEKFTGENDDK